MGDALISEDRAGSRDRTHLDMDWCLHGGQARVRGSCGAVACEMRHWHQVLAISLMRDATVELSAQSTYTRSDLGIFTIVLCQNKRPADGWRSRRRVRKSALMEYDGQNVNGFGNMSWEGI